MATSLFRRNLPQASSSARDRTWDLAPLCGRRPDTNRNQVSEWPGTVAPWNKSWRTLPLLFMDYSRLEGKKEASNALHTESHRIWIMYEILIATRNSWKRYHSFRCILGTLAADHKRLLQSLIQETSVRSIRSMHKKNSVVWVRERTIPTERPPLVGEVTVNFCG
jgi:hypothetical protein